MKNTQDPRILGRAFAPGSSAYLEAEISVTQDNIFLLDPLSGQILTRAARDQVKLDNPVGTGPRNTHFPDNWMFQTLDPQISTLMQEPLSNRLLRYLRFSAPALAW
ncbi:hypothetical protein [Pseudophaeobacter sp.]|uniref:DUF7092 domain-containing protein n=1 Tax=Pseudophaeobacter sp. TaxID=1971739 RepID=UPI003296947B